LHFLYRLSRMAAVFISYAREDKAFVARLHDALKERDRDTWVDWEGIPPSVEWMKEIHAAIEGSDTFVFVMSPDSIASNICGQELSHAVEQNKRLIPVVCRDVSPSAVVPALAKLNWIFLREDDNFETEFRSLIAAIDTDFDWVQKHTRLLTRAIEWEKRGNDNSVLLRGNDLRAAEEWLGSSGNKEPKPTGIQTQYLFASRKAERSRQRNTLIGVTVSLVVAVVLAAVAWYQRNEKQRQLNVALSSQLAAQSRNVLGQQSDLSLLLAVQAYRILATLDAKNALLSSLQHAPQITSFLHGHTEKVSSFATSPDGRVLASGGCRSSFQQQAFCSEGEIRLWNLSTHQPIGSPLKAHVKEVFSLAFSPDGMVLASGSCGAGGKFCAKGEIILWNVRTGKVLGSLAGHDEEVNSLAFSPDGKVLASGSPDGKIILWQVDTRQPVESLDHPDVSSVFSLAFSPDGKFLVSGHNGRTAIWDVAQKKIVSLSTPVSKAAILTLAFSPDGKVFASGSCAKLLENECVTGEIRIWNLASHEMDGPPLVAHAGTVGAVAFGLDGETLISVSTDSVILWDVRTRRPRATPQSRYTFENSKIFFGPDRSIRVFGSRFNTVVEWDTNLTEPISNTVDTGRFTTHTVMFNPDAKALVVSGCIASKEECGREIRRWDVATLKPDGEPIAIGARITGLAYTSDGKWFATGADDGGITLWDAASRQKLGGFSVLTDASVDNLEFSPDGKSLAMGSSRMNGSLVLADTTKQPPTMHPLEAPEEHGAFIYGVAFSPDGKTLATANGSQGASGGPSDGTVALWDIAERKFLTNLFKDEEYGAMSVAFSRDGKMLASGLGHGGVLLWDMKTRKQIGQPLMGHKFEATYVAFSSDNSTLVSAGQDGKIILWDVATLQPIGNIANKIAIGSVALSSDDRNLAAMVCAEGRPNTRDCNRFELRLWDISTASWIARACRIANRNLTKEEWNRYFGNEPYRETCSDPTTAKR
jgi:WD40 repeat protein